MHFWKSCKNSLAETFGLAEISHKFSNDGRNKDEGTLVYNHWK